MIWNWDFAPPWLPEDIWGTNALFGSGRVHHYIQAPTKCLAYGMPSKSLLKENKQTKKFTDTLKNTQKRRDKYFCLLNTYQAVSHVSVIVWFSNCILTTYHELSFVITAEELTLNETWLFLLHWTKTLNSGRQTKTRLQKKKTMPRVW